MTIYEKQGGTYRKSGDYCLPNLTLNTEQNAQISVWGMRHKRYLKQHQKVIYYNLLTAGILNSYLDADVSGIEKVSRKNNNRFYQVIFYKLLSDFQLRTIIG